MRTVGRAPKAFCGLETGFAFVLTLMVVLVFLSAWPRVGSDCALARAIWGGDGRQGLCGLAEDGCRPISSDGRCSQVVSHIAAFCFNASRSSCLKLFVFICDKCIPWRVHSYFSSAHVEALPLPAFMATPCLPVPSAPLQSALIPPMGSYQPSLL